MSTKAQQKEAAQERAKENAAKKAKKTNSSSKSSSSKSSSSSFNASQYGSNFSQAFNSADPGTQAAASVLLSQIQNNAVLQNGPAPAVLDDKELKKLWNQASNDPTIKQTYADQLAAGTKSFNDQIDLFSQDYAQLTDQEKQDYVTAKKQLEETAANAGQTYSGFRKQAQDTLQKQSSDVIASSTRQAQSQLNDLESQFEQTYGSAALASLNKGSIAAGTGTPIGGQSNWNIPTTSGISYTPIGGVAGTQSQNELADVTSQDQELQQEQLQQDTGSNYNDWLKQLKKTGNIK